jgi:hypothetical protein
MDKDLENFRAWYVKILESLYPTRDAGIAALMITMPLLERYLRQKNGRTPEQELDGACMETLRAIFPALPDVATARSFWAVYRHGFLHQATLSLRTRRGAALPPGSLTHDTSVPIAIAADGSFELHPVFFSREVVAAIERDFAVFVGVGTPAPKLPEVVVTPTVPVKLSTKGG